MKPSFATRGKLILCAALSFVILGAARDSSPLIILGATVLIFFFAAYLWFFPVAILLRRRKVEISWWIPVNKMSGGTLHVDQGLPLQIALRNHGARGMRVLEIEVLASSALAPPTGLEAFMTAGSQVNIEGMIRAREPGYHLLHGAVLRFGDLLGLFTLHAYFPSPLPIKVYPRALLSAVSARQVRDSGGAARARQGPHQLNRRGLSGDLRELRDHQQGDPFKNIAWKATARHRKLMVRDLENEVILTHQFLLDVGCEMRLGETGKRKLDQAIDLVSGLAHAAIEAGDRVGLIAYDTRIYSELSPDEGSKQFRKILDRLVEVNGIVDQDLTSLTESELTASIATYLLQQEGVDTRILRAPPIDSPRWETIQAGPQGQLFDVQAIERIVGSVLRVIDSASASARGSGHSISRRNRDPFPWKTKERSDLSPPNQKMRRFARLRGIEFPYRHCHEPTLRLAGLSAALRQSTAAGVRADSTTIITDLAGIVGQPGLKIADLARVGRGGRRVVILTPTQEVQTRNFTNKKSMRLQLKLEEVAQRDQQLHLAQATALMRANGVTLLTASRHESSTAILSKIAGARATNRRTSLVL